MSRRITLTEFEIEQIIAALTVLKDETNLPYQVIKIGKWFYKKLIDKLQPEAKP